MLIGEFGTENSQDQQDGNTLDYCIAPENLLFRWEQPRYEEGTLVFQLPYWLSLNTNCEYISLKTSRKMNHILIVHYNNDANVLLWRL